MQNIKTLYICILATSLYNDYLLYFYKSLKNFKLKQFNIKIIIISDRKPDNSYLYYPIAHFPYPFNTYLKTYIINHALQYFNINENDYIMYIDADTIIRKCNNYDYFEECLLSNKMIFSISSWAYQSNYGYENSLLRFNYPELYIKNYKNTDFIQTSFFAGNIKQYKKFNSLCFNLCQSLTKDWKNKRVPPMQDQSIITKIIYDNRNDYIINQFIVDTYQDYKLENCNNIELNEFEYDGFNIKEHPNVFLIQKFNANIKETIRYSIVL